jgi:DNA-binding response OmpR family regulator
MFTKQTIVLTLQHTNFRSNVRVLIIEDEDVMADAIATGLRREGFAVDVSYDGSAGLTKALDLSYDVVILDRDLPRLHGDEVCNRLTAEKPSTKILMLTASGQLAERIAGLNLGADDYLAKPFAFAELVARVHALTRRTAEITPPVLQTGPLTIDRARRHVERDGHHIELSVKEFEVLWVLASVISAEQLLERVWDENADPFTNAIRVTLVGLRKKLGDPPLIETIRGAGYRLDLKRSSPTPAARSPK